MAQRWPKRRDLLTHVRKVAERQRRDDIALGEGGGANNPTGGGGGGSGALSIISQQLSSSQSAGDLPFGLEIAAVGAHYADGQFFPDSEGWWMALCWLRFFGDELVGDGVVRGIIRLHDDNDAYEYRENRAPTSARLSGGIPLSFGDVIVATEPILIDSSYSNPYFTAGAGTDRTESPGTVSGTFFGAGTKSQTASRMSVWRVA